ncbi:MAG: hypothetical protein ACRC9R_02695, partial [Enterovibrio sp.]
MLRVNDEQNSERRRFLLVKVLRAFSESSLLWEGVLNSICALLNIELRRVNSWSVSMPDIPTVPARGTPRAADGAPTRFDLRMPVDVMSLEEVIWFLQSHLREVLHLNQAPYTIRATPAQEPLMMRLTFSEEFIQRQDPILRRLLRDFNRALLDERCKTFAKAICILKESTLPHGTYSQLCDLLGVRKAGISNWHYEYKKRLLKQGQAQRMAGLQPAAVPFAAPAVTTAATPAAQMLAPAPPQTTAAPMLQAIATTSTAPSSIPAATAQMPLTLPAATSASVTRSAAAPVFATPATPSTSAAAQLAPVVPPFFVQTEDEKEEEEQMEQEAVGAQGELPLPSQESEEEFREMLAYDSDVVGLASMTSDELYFFLEG